MAEIDPGFVHSSLLKTFTVSSLNIFRLLDFLSQEKRINIDRLLTNIHLHIKHYDRNYATITASGNLGTILTGKKDILHY